MRRRSFLQSIGVLFGWRFVPRLQAPISAGLIYSDSESTDLATLATLGDRVTTGGGVSYGA